VDFESQSLTNQRIDLFIVTLHVVLMPERNYGLRSMGRSLAAVVFFLVFMALLLALGSLVARAADNPAALATANPSGLQAAEQTSRNRFWYDIADVGLRIATLMVLSAGLVGTFAVLTSLRASAYSQIYTRFQGLLLKLADNPVLFDRMKSDEYTAEENDPTTSTATNPHRFIANAMVNLYEEAFLLYESRVLNFIDPLPADYWQSILGSMRAAFQLRYVRTHWERRQAVFSSKFNTFIREKILDFVGSKPAPDVV
jgi:hypothetical protein